MNKKEYENLIIGINKYLIFLVFIPLFIVDEDFINKNKEIIYYLDILSSPFNGIQKYYLLNLHNGLEYYVKFQLLFAIFIGFICFCISCINLYKVYHYSVLSLKSSKFFNVEILEKGYTLNNKSFVIQLLAIFLILDFFIFSLFTDIFNESSKSLVFNLILETKIGISITGAIIVFVFGVMTPRLFFEIYGRFFIHKKI